MTKINDTSAAPGEAGGILQALEVTTPAIQISGHPALGSCDCGSVTFVLVNELTELDGPGIRASRMYECTACGEYRLGK
jgi:hypothetical protein